MQFEWHHGARDRLEHRVRLLIGASALDAEARRAELRAKVEAELARPADLAKPGGTLVTVAEVDAAFERVLQGERTEGSLRSAPTKALRGFRRAWYVVACVLGPAFVLAVELTTRMCAAEFFDPLPTLAHVLAVAFVPLAAAFVLFARRESASPELASWASLGLGFAIAISSTYFLAYLPLLPLAVFALLAMGLGFLPLTPIFCFPSLCFLAISLAKFSSDRGLRQGARIGLGIGAGILFFALIEAPAVMTRRWIAAASVDSRAERATAIDRLRTFGSEELFARLASGDDNAAIGPFWLFGTTHAAITTEDARKVWYRVHGEPFRGPLRSADSRGFTEFDPDLGGTTIGVGARGLELRGSRLDAAVDGTAGVAYVEWILELTNTNAWGVLEGRALVELPDEAVVSRATLWVAGEEREAAYASTASTRAAYRTVAVVQRRDPLLVTSASDDVVLAQVFPVNAGATMKWKLGITVPLALDGTSAHVPLPRLIDRNFRLGADLEHHVWIQSHEELACDVLSVTKSGDRFEARGGLPAETLDALGAQSTRPFVTVRREDVPSVELALDDGRRLVCAFERTSRAETPAPVVVVDGSRALRPWKDAIEPALREAFAGQSLSVFVATDTGVEHIALSPGSPADAIEDAAEWEGGLDILPALETAWDAARTRGTDLVWLSGPQPVLLSSIEPLAQRLEREPAGPRIAVLAMVPGENRVLFEFSREARIERAVLGADLVRALRLARGVDDIERRWSVVDAVGPGGRSGPKHLSALAASETVEELLRATPPRREEALAVATENRIVTRVSGAVVLETAQQFEASGLSPAEAETLPSVPEPEVVLLALIALCAALVAVARRRRAGLA